MRQFDVREAFSVFYRRRRLGLIIVAATLAGVYVGNYLTYPAYESSVKILVERAPGFEIPFSREQIAFKKAEITETQCELLQSNAVLEETVRQLRLDQRPLPTGSLRDSAHALGRRIVTWYRGLKDGFKRFLVVRLLGKSYVPRPPADPFRQAVEDLRDVVRVEPVPNTDIIAVIVRDYEAAMAARIADAIAQIYLGKDVEAQRARARQVYDLVDAQVTAFRPSYEEAERAVEQFERDHEARLLQEQIRAKIQEISAMELSYSELVETQKTKILSLNMELARLRQTYDPNHPKVLTVQSELMEARKRLEAPATQATGTAPAGEMYAGTLLARIAKAKQELAEFNRLDGEYSRLTRKKEQEEALYLSLKKKREEAQIAEATRAAGTRVVDPAVAALQPRYPRKTLNLLLGLAGGLLAAGAFCALLEFLDRSVKTPDDVARATGLDASWSIPDWRQGALFGIARRRSQKTDGKGLIADFASQAPFVRAHATMFEQLCLLVAAEQRPFLIVTSSSRGEGRTGVAANLALCCARLGGCRALLIDADFERPMLSRMFGMNGSHGVGDVLAGRAEWQDHLRPVGDGVLSLLPAGTTAASSLVATETTRLAALVDEWRSKFDWIIVDTPPVSLSASALVLGRQATGALIVVRAGYTRTEVVSDTADRLRAHAVRPLGVVLNRRRLIIPRYAYRRL